MNVRRLSHELWQSQIELELAAEVQSKMRSPIQLCGKLKRHVAQDPTAEFVDGYRLTRSELGSTYNVTMSVHFCAG